MVGPEFGTVFYAILGNSCYFSGINRTGGPRSATSTINAAEDIITAIAKQEGIPAKKLQFFDLQTQEGYQKLAGVFELDKVVFEVTDDGVVENLSWSADVPCPPQVQYLFRDLIGDMDPAIKVWSPDEALRSGYAPSGRCSHNNGPCFELAGINKYQEELIEKMSGKARLMFSRLTSALKRTIVVDNENHPYYLEVSKGKRYCLWNRDPLREN